MDNKSPTFGGVSHTDQAQGESVRSTWGREDPAQRQQLDREPRPPLPPTVQTDEMLRLRLAEELDYARRILEVMGNALSADNTVVVRHMVQLQSVDIVGQMLGHIAAVVRSSEPEDEVARIGMCELKARLQRRNRL